MENKKQDEVFAYHYISEADTEEIRVYINYSDDSYTIEMINGENKTKTKLSKAASQSFAKFIVQRTI